MPIRPDLRQHYGQEWQEETRPAILERAGNCCERCKVPNHTTIVRIDDPEYSGWWFTIDGDAFDNSGALQGSVRGSEMPPPRFVDIVLTIAHVNHTSGDDRPENLLALCQWCHLDNEIDNRVDVDSYPAMSGDVAEAIRDKCSAILRRRAEEFGARYTPELIQGNHVPDIILMMNLEDVARTGPESGGTAFAVHHSASLELDRIIFYAWGMDAHTFADIFGIRSHRDTGPTDAELGAHAAGLVDGDLREIPEMPAVGRTPYKLEEIQTGEFYPPLRGTNPPPNSPRVCGLCDGSGFRMVKWPPGTEPRRVRCVDCDERARLAEAAE